MKSNVSKPAASRNYAIDAIRFIAICFVIYIHIFEINKGYVFSEDLSWKITDILFALSRLAVPVFFAISGWFIFSNNKGDQVQKLQKQIPKLIKILITATIGVAFVLWVFTELHLVLSPLPYLPQIRSLFEMFALGRSPSIGPLWFLVSLIIVEIIFWMAAKKLKNDYWLLVPAFVFFCLNLLFGAYRSIFGFPELPFPIYETWFVGLTWFSVGYFLAKYFKDSPDKIKSKTLWFFAITCFALYFYEYIMHTSGAPFVFGPYNYVAIFIFTPFVTAAILLLAARSQKDGKIIRTLAGFGSKYALGIFIIHLVVMQPLNAFFTHFGLLQGYPTFKLIVTYSSVVVISLALTAAYYTLKPKLFNSVSKLPFNKS